MQRLGVTVGLVVGLQSVMWVAWVPLLVADLLQCLLGGATATPRLQMLRVGLMPGLQLVVWVALRTLLVGWMR